MTFSSTTDRFAIIPVTHGPAPDDAIVVGPMSEVMEYIPQSVARNDAHEELERARSTADQIASVQQKTRAVQATMLADSVNHLSARLDSFLTHREEQRRRDAEREEEEEQQRISDELASLPDPDNPDAHTHIPGGDLHALPAKHEQQPEPTEEVRGGPNDQAEFGLPEDPTGVSIPQPIAAEFDGD